MIVSYKQAAGGFILINSDHLIAARECANPENTEVQMREVGNVVIVAKLSDLLKELQKK